MSKAIAVVGHQFLFKKIMRKSDYIFTENALIHNRFHVRLNRKKEIVSPWDMYDVYLYHTQDGLLHHDTDYALEWKDCPEQAFDDEVAYRQGLSRLFWIQKGIIHRTNGPAIIGLDDQKNVREWQYVQDGFHSNSYGPAMFAPNVDFGKHIYEWGYKSKYIIPVAQKLKPAMALDLPGVGMVTVLKQLDGYVYEVLYGNKKFPIIGSQNVKSFDIDYYMTADFPNLFITLDQ